VPGAGITVPFFEIPYDGGQSRFELPLQPGAKILSIELQLVVNYGAGSPNLSGSIIANGDIVTAKLYEVSNTTQGFNALSLIGTENAELNTLVANYFTALRFDFESYNEIVDVDKIYLLEITHNGLVGLNTRWLPMASIKVEMEIDSVEQGFGVV